VTLPLAAARILALSSITAAPVPATRPTSGLQDLRPNATSLPPTLSKAVPTTVLRGMERSVAAVVCTEVVSRILLGVAPTTLSTARAPLQPATVTCWPTVRRTLHRSCHGPTLRTARVFLTVTRPEALSSPALSVPALQHGLRGQCRVQSVNALLATVVRIATSLRTRAPMEEFGVRH